MCETLDNEFRESGDTTVDDLIEEHIPEQQPDLGIAEDLQDLVLLDRAAEDASATACVLCDERGSLFGGESC